MEQAKGEKQLLKGFRLLALIELACVKVIISSQEIIAQARRGF